MSLARATDDPTLKKRYETMALDFLERGDADSQGIRGIKTAAIKTGAIETGAIENGRHRRERS